MIRFTRYMRPVCLKGQAHASWCTRREIFSHPFWSVRRRNYGTPAASKAGSDAQAQSFKDFLADTQLNIIQAAEDLQGASSFKLEPWDRPEGSPNPGHGITAVLEGGSLLEKAAVSTTFVQGTLSAQRAKAMSSRGRAINQEGGQRYAAAALSLVFHPAHPLVPTLRADVRRFEVEGQAWFGGGADLTPAYLCEQDAREFHTFWSELCSGHRSGLYEEYKEWCDQYFYLPAWGEHRGVGGIFFDDLPSNEADFNAEKFVRDVAEGFIPSWHGIAERSVQRPFTEHQRQWQLQRRGAYVCFNLLYDRGVRFGLEGNKQVAAGSKERTKPPGWTVSFPPLVAWPHTAEPDEGTSEAALLEVLRKPRSWAS